MLSNAGVNLNDSVQVRNYLNSYYNRNYSYAAYSQVLSGCANQTLTYVLALPGIEAEETKGGYRFGFNGKEKDDETYGDGNTQDYGMRVYDNRLGRFLSLDPITRSFSFWSPYHFAANTPIMAIDFDGLQPVKATTTVAGVTYDIRINRWFSQKIVIQSEDGKKVVVKLRSQISGRSSMYLVSKNTSNQEPLADYKTAVSNGGTIGQDNPRDYNYLIKRKIHGQLTIQDAIEAILNQNKGDISLLVIGNHGIAIGEPMLEMRFPSETKNIPFLSNEQAVDFTTKRAEFVGKYFNSENVLTFSRFNVRRIDYLMHPLGRWGGDPMGITLSFKWGKAKTKTSTSSKGSKIIYSPRFL